MLHSAEIISYLSDSFSVSDVLTQELKAKLNDKWGQHVIVLEEAAQNSKCNYVRILQENNLF